MNREKPIVGQTVYIERIYRNQPREIEENKVERIGRTYFYLEGMDNPIGLKDWVYRNSNYSQFNFQVYSSKEEIDEKNEKNDFFETLRKAFDWTGKKETFSLQQLRDAVKILNL